METPEIQFNIEVLVDNLRRQIPKILQVRHSKSIEGPPIIEVSDPSLRKTAMYEVTATGIKGPDPVQDSDGKSNLSVAIENIIEYLALNELPYQPQPGYCIDTP